MDDRSHTGIPLIGALLIEAGLITMEQLQVCLLLQSERYLGIPFGQILVNSGYISQNDLSHILILQSEIRSSILTSFEERIETPSDLSAIVVYEHNPLQLIPLLQRMGVAARPAFSWTEMIRSWAWQRPDLIVIDPRLIDQHADLSEQALVPIMPLPLALNQQTGWLETPTWAVTVLSQFVGQIRQQREYQELRVELKQRESELNAITAFNQILTTIYPPYEALSKLMMRLRDLMQVEAGALYRLDWTERQLIFEVAFGPQSTLLHQRRISVDEGIIGWVARYRRPLMLSDAASDPRFNPQVDQQPGSTARSLLCLPLIMFGEVHGVLQLTNKLHEESFTKRDLFLLRIIATMISFAQVQAPHMRERDIDV